MLNVLKGTKETGQVWLNGQALSPKKSQEVTNHSPDGFAWGYGGSGPAQLALAVLLELTEEKTALSLYADFKWHYLAPLDIDSDFEISFDTEQVVPKGALEA